MFENLKNTIIDTTKEEYKDFPIFLDGHTFIDYDNGWVTIPKIKEITEQDRINAINSKANEIIETKYPLYKQNNIIRLATPYTQQDLTDMSLWIDSKRDICHNAVEQGLQPDEVIWGE